MDCIFCKLAQHEIPTDIVYEDEQVFAFRDASPQAPVHYLFIPKEHVSSINDLDEQNAGVVSAIFARIAEVAQRDGFAEAGYRVVSNCGKDGGQTVPHLHFHVLAGREFTWPAG